MAVLCCAGALWAQTPQADATLPLFTVMAAINAASDADGPYTSALSKQLRQDLAGKDIPSIKELRRFLTHAPAEYTHLVSFALVIDGPPDFAFHVREADLPSDAKELSGLNPILSSFYAEAGIEKLWAKYRPAFDEQATIYQESIARVMLEVNGYLRSPTSGYLGRTFSVYIDLLGPPNQVNARSFGVDYYVVVTPSAQPQLDEVRHGYLHYVLEPLASKHAGLIKEREKLLSVASRAPALDPALQENFRLLLCEALIRTTEIRMSRLPEAEKQKKIAAAVSEGHFLSSYFYEAMETYEKQDAGIRIYYPTLIEKLDVRREERRAEQVAFRSTPLPRLLAESAQRVVFRGGDETERLLAEGEDAIARKEFKAARDAYRTALERSSESTTANAASRARALYGLALVATQERQPEVAKNFFQQTLETASEPQLLAWSHIYLGRLLDMENKRDQAVRHYQQALDAGDSAANAKQAAQRGLEAPFKKDN